MRISKQTTLNDVARISGVSHQTVSRVINQHPNVSLATRERVLAVVEKLGYQPNRAARRLVTGKSNSIGLVSYGTTYYGPAQMLSSIETVLRQKALALATANISTMSLTELKQAIYYLKSQQVDGLILISPLLIDLDGITELCSPLPFVTVDVTARVDFPSVAIDQHYGAKLATKHLLELGHSQIGHISGPLNWTDAQLRYQGWLDSLDKAALSESPHIESDWTAQGGYTACKKLLKDSQGFSALFVGNDQMALGAMHAVHEQGLRVPQDISIVGFDDIPEAAFFHPPLSTIRQNFPELGRQSVAYLLELLAKTKPLKASPLNPDLIIRQSTKEVSRG